MIAAVTSASMTQPIGPSVYTTSAKRPTDSVALPASPSASPAGSLAGGVLAPQGVDGEHAGGERVGEAQRGGVERARLPRSRGTGARQPDDPDEHRGRHGERDNGRDARRERPALRAEEPHQPAGERPAQRDLGRDEQRVEPDDRDASMSEKREDDDDYERRDHAEPRSEEDAGDHGEVHVVGDGHDLARHRDEHQRRDDAEQSHLPALLAARRHLRRDPEQRERGDPARHPQPRGQDPVGYVDVGHGATPVRDRRRGGSAGTSRTGRRWTPRARVTTNPAEAAFSIAARFSGQGARSSNRTACTRSGGGALRSRSRGSAPGRARGPPAR